mgnify:CR=1 FL=1
MPAIMTRNDILEAVNGVVNQMIANGVLTEKGWPNLLSTLTDQLNQGRTLQDAVGQTVTLLTPEGSGFGPGGSISNQRMRAALFGDINLALSKKQQVLDQAQVQVTEPYLKPVQQQISPEALAELDKFTGQFYSQARGEAQAGINRQVAAATGRAASRFAQGSSFGSPAEEYTYGALERAGTEALAPQLAQLGVQEAQSRQRGREFVTTTGVTLADLLQRAGLTREQLQQQAYQFGETFHEGKRQFDITSQLTKEQLEEEKKKANKFKFKPTIKLPMGLEIGAEIG